MAYTYQTFTVGQVLTAAQMQQIEDSIRDHVHGQSSVSAPVNTAVPRQTVLRGPFNAFNNSGTAHGPVLLTSGTGLAVSRNGGSTEGTTGTTLPVLMSFASGFDSKGAVDYYSRLTAIEANAWSGLSASNTSFLYCDYSSISAVTYGKTLVPPIYGEIPSTSADANLGGFGYSYDTIFGKGALLNFDGADASTTIVDGFGHTWTANANAQLDTAQSKFGGSSLLLDGTGDYISSTSFFSLGDSSWEVSFWVRFAALPGSGTRQMMFSAGNSSGFGVLLALLNDTGVTKAEVWLSSNGSSWDLASSGRGTNTSWAINTWYKFRFIFDALAGSYKLFLSVDGAAESTDYSLSSSSRICAVSEVDIGKQVATAGSNLNGWVDAFRYVRCATNTSAETPSASAPAITDYPYHIFDIPSMTMYEVTAASSGAAHPTVTARTRLFVGETDTSAAAVSAVRTYAYMGRYRSTPAALPAADTRTVHAANIGTTVGVSVHARVISRTPHMGSIPGDEFGFLAYDQQAGPSEFHGPPVYLNGRNSIVLTVGNTGLVTIDATGTAIGLQSGGAGPSYRYYIEARREW